MDKLTSVARDTTWRRIKAALRLAPLPGEWRTSIMTCEQIVSYEVDDALSSSRIPRECYQVQVVLASAKTGAAEEHVENGLLEECCVYIRLTSKPDRLMEVFDSLERRLERRLSRYHIRVRAVYWRMG